ncbi:hypothetical protein TNCV_2878951 [Trichonephila clavipes]|uniref:Uncharacterized protein n=1 Tax=Trichonephila clavipes TaxID=2585209 RepID=A0A8X7BC88_TRICX|nr:hypothetical protein TNCV_2878951 [Trichonephila clavipes]
MFQILLWSPWKYRCGQRTVRMAVVACSQKQRSLRAQAHQSKSRTETCELVKVKPKLLDIRAELEREKGERERSWHPRLLNKFVVGELRINMNTVVDCRMFCHAVCMFAIVNESTGIGHKGVIVESKLRKMKYGRGKPFYGNEGLLRRDGNIMQNITCATPAECAPINGSICLNGFCKCPEDMTATLTVPTVFLNLTTRNDTSYCLPTLLVLFTRGNSFFLLFCPGAPPEKDAYTWSQKRKLDGSGAREINRLYPESRKKG